MDILKLAGRKEGTRGISELKILFRYLSTSPINNMRYARILIEKDKDQNDQSLSETTSQGIQSSPGISY